ncbi:MAG: hypothetical protein H6Q79_839 [Deltaproteobacteria bacterium]|nr:hypothetical protein [Deltaproteobacteria bacterium]
MRGGIHGCARIAAVALLALPALLAVPGILVLESPAEGLTGYLEFDYSINDTNIMAAGSRTVRTKSDSFLQLYNLTLQKKLYPNLEFLASGTFQNRDTSFDVEGVKNDATTTTRRPYLNLNLRTPLYYAEVLASRNEEKVKTPGLSLTTVRDTFIPTLYWRPDGFPDLKLQYLWDHVYDKEGLTVDTVTNTFQVTSNYLPVENLRLYYQGTLRNTDLRLNDTTAEETNNNVRVNYSNSWWQRRITFALDYNYNGQVIDTTTAGAGELEFPVFTLAGLSALSDTPDNVVLASNPALIDGNNAASTGINLGLATPGGDNRLRNMGLDFGSGTEANALYVSVDRDVAQVAGAFIWRIYTSGDNQNWTLRQTVSPAIYSPTFNRFEIRFANVNDRYVKVVTAPLSPAVPFASAYPTILVTELQAVVRRPASEVAGKLTSTFQNGTVDFRAVLMEALALTYEFSYVFTQRDPDPGKLLYIVTNGLSFSRQFDRVFSGAGRISFETGEEQQGSYEALKYTASLTAVPFPTLYHSLLFSGQDQTVAGRRITNNSIFLYNIAKFYEGIDGNLSAGIIFQEDDTGLKNTGTQVNAGVTFVPNQKVNLTLFYNGSTNVTSGGILQGETENYTRAGEADLAITPASTVYLFGSYRIEQSTTAASRDILNFTVNWAPFPDGTLHVYFFYNETIRSDDFKDRSIIPSLRWYFTPRSYLDLSYQNLKTESPTLSTASNIYSGTVRITF